MQIHLFISSIIAPVFYKLLFMSLTGLCIAVVIMIIRRVADFYISPHWKYAIWILAFIALILPFRPETNLSLINISQNQNISFKYDEIAINRLFEQYRYNQFDNSAPVTDGKVTAETALNAIQKDSVFFDIILPSIWFTACIGSSLFMLITALRLRLKIKAHKLSLDYKPYYEIAEVCRSSLGLDNKDIEIIIQDFVNTPAVIGLFRPVVILPTFIKELDKESISHILLHELAHIKRKDLIINYMLIAFQVIYWFNPFLLFIFKYVRQDMELSNDAYVLSILGYEKHKEYSVSLVSVLAEYNGVSFVPRMLCMIDNKRNIERRIKMIKLRLLFKKRRFSIAIVSLMLMLCIGTLFLTTNASDKKEKDIEPGISASIKTLNNTGEQESQLGSTKVLDEYLAKSVTEEDMKFYCESLDNSNTAASITNRNLSHDEEMRMLILDDQYTYEGLRPKNTLPLEPGDYDYYYDIKKDSFHYPDRPLTDEELLMTIDMRTKINYALMTRVERSGNKPIPTDKDMKEEVAIVIAEENLKKIFETDPSNLVVRASFGRDSEGEHGKGTWFITYEPYKTNTLNALGEKYWRYYVLLDSETGAVSDINRVYFHREPSPELSEDVVTAIAKDESWIIEAKKIFEEKVRDKRKIVDAKLLGINDVEVDAFKNYRPDFFSMLLKKGGITVALELEDGSYCAIEMYYYDRSLQSVSFIADSKILLINKDPFYMAISDFFKTNS